MQWNDGSIVQSSLLTLSAPRAVEPVTEYRVPARFVDMARRAATNADPQRWALLYRVLWRIVRENHDLLDVERDITRLEELDALVKAKPVAGGSGGGGGRAPAGPPPKGPDKRRTPIDELAFLKSVTEDDKGAPSPRRASGAQFQPVEPVNAVPVAPENPDAEVAKTLKCKECGTMNLATEWYCEKCGGELAAM